MAALESSASLWLDQAVGHHVEGDLDATEAAALTAKIKAYVGVTWLLLNEAHERRADKALGYASWAEYVEAEFDMSRSYAYRLIAHAKAVYELAGKAGLSDVSPIGDIPEGKTRAIDIEEVAAEVERQAAALPADATDEDRAEVVRQSLAKQTTKRTTTETTETTFDPETGEVLSPQGDTDTSGSDQSHEGQTAPTDTPTSAGDAAGPGDDEQPASPAPSPAPKVAPDAAQQTAALRKAFFDALKRTDLTDFDIEAVAVVLTEDDWLIARNSAMSVQQWFDRLLSHQPKGLRVVNGGRS